MYNGDDTLLLYTLTVALLMLALHQQPQQQDQTFMHQQHQLKLYP
jgi:hypothetical protein